MRILYPLPCISWQKNINCLNFLSATCLVQDLQDAQARTVFPDVGDDSTSSGKDEGTCTMEEDAILGAKSSSLKEIRVMARSSTFKHESIPSSRSTTLLSRS